MALASSKVVTNIVRDISTKPPQAKKNIKANCRPALGDLRNKTASAIYEKSNSSLPAVSKVIGRKISEQGKDDSPVIEEDVDREAVDEEVVAIPANVTDIDAQPLDTQNPQLCAEYAPAMYAYLRSVEDGLVIKKDFLKGSSINGKMRGVLVDWLIEVHSQFRLLQETLYMTVYIIDKYLQVEGLTIRRAKLQLVGVSAMFIASKVEEMYPPEINDFVYISDNSCSAADIRQMELKLLNSLCFNFSRPLPLHFLRRDSKAGDVDVLQHTLAKYFVEISLVEYDMAHLPPSLVAAAALFLSLRILEPNQTLDTVWSPTLQHYSTYSKDQLIPVACQLSQALVKAKDTKLQAVHTKYLSKKFMKVGEMKELWGEVVIKLAKKDVNGL